MGVMVNDQYIERAKTEKQENPEKNEALNNAFFHKNLVEQ
jgi:hypothetical protein